MTTGAPEAILIDTSTIMELPLHDAGSPRVPDGAGAAAVEALVLFEHVYLDGRTVSAELPPFRWLDELDNGIEFINNSRDEVQATYRAGMALAERITRSDDTARLLLRHHADIRDLRAAGLPARYAANDTVVWNDVRDLAAQTMPAEVAAFIDRLLRDLRTDEAGGALLLARFCYYLALQQRLGSLLLLHPTKYVADGSTLGHAKSILDMFDHTVQSAYQQRRRDWLGERPREVSLPLLTRYVLAESVTRGWSVGRTISWLRTRPEVRLFREGLTELLDRVASEDHVGVDEVISELDRAAHLWAGQLGAKPAVRKVSLQVAIPLLAPSFEVPVPRLTRTPAQKLLVLVDRMLQAAPR